MRSTFTPEARGAVLQGLRAGLTLAEAALDADLAPKTVRNWLTRGRAEADTEHAVFAEAVDAAREAAATAAMGESEFRGYLNRAVRAGSVQAMRLWWVVNAAVADDDVEVDEFAVLDEFDGSVIDRLARSRDGHRQRNGGRKDAAA